MAQSSGKKSQNPALGMYIFTAMFGGAFLFFGFQEARYSLFGMTAVAKVTHKAAEWRSHKGGAHQVFVLDYSYRDKEGKERDGHDEVHSSWSFGTDETVQIEYIPGANLSSRVKGAKNVGLLLWIVGVFTAIGGTIAWLIRRSQAKAAVELEPLTQSEFIKPAGDSSEDRPQSSVRKRFAPGVPKFSDDALVCRCAGWMGKPVSVIVDRAKGMIHFQNCLTLRKFLALSAEPWFSCPLSELTATHHCNNKGTQSLVIVAQSGKAWISSEVTNYSELCQTLTDLLPDGGQGFSVDHPAMGLFYVFAAFGGFFLGWSLVPKGASNTTLGLVIVGTMIATFVAVHLIVSWATSSFKTPSPGRTETPVSEDSPPSKRSTAPPKTLRNDSWKSDVPSTATNSGPLVVKIAGGCGLVACLLLFWHFAFAKPTPVAVGTATVVTQPPIPPVTATQPVTPMPVTPQPPIVTEPPPTTPVAQPVSPTTVATWNGWSKDTPAPAIAPFNAEQAKQHQEVWAKHLGVPVEFTNSIGMKFRLIPPGEFMMGSTAAEVEEALKFATGYHSWHRDPIRSEAPQHKVVLTQPIYMGTQEVTQSNYETVMGRNPSEYSSTGRSKTAVAGMDTKNFPVETVTWNNAAEFCAKLSHLDRLKPSYSRVGNTISSLDGNGYRLPTEAEWEFACRAGTVSKYWSGDDDGSLSKVGWVAGNAGDRTHAAAELRANPFGLYDMHGNAWEWVQDGWDATTYSQLQAKPAIDPSCPFSGSSRRVLRSGGIVHAASFGRSANRGAIEPLTFAGDRGFRAILHVAGVKAALANSVKAEAPPVVIRGKELRRLEGHQGPVWKTVFSADGKRVLSGSGFPKGDSTMRLWDVETGREIRQFRNDGTNWVFGVALSLDGKQALSGNAFGITLRDVETGAVLRRMDFDSTNKTVLTVAFAPDGKRAVSGGSDHVVRVWDLTNGTQIQTLTGHLGRVMSVGYSPDGSQIVSCGLDADKTVRLWNTESGKESHRLEGHTAGVESVAFTPDGNRIISSGFDGLILWDAKTGKSIRKIDGDGTDFLEAVFLPDGRRALCASKSGRVSIWDSETGQELHRLEQSSEWVWTVAVSPDGRHGVSAGGSSNVNGKWIDGKDFAIRLWSLAD